MNDTFTDVKHRSKLQWMLQMYHIAKEYRSSGTSRCPSYALSGTSYAPPMPRLCPVRYLLCAVQYNLCAPAIRCHIAKEYRSSGTSLCPSYALSGISYALSGTGLWSCYTLSGTGLCACYALSGTDLVLLPARLNLATLLWDVIQFWARK
eukprot:3383987-Rhodomonas_salina.1